MAIDSNKEAIRRRYYEDVAAGRVKLPQHDFTLRGSESPPTPRQKLLAAMKADEDALAITRQPDKEAVVDPDYIPPKGLGVMSKGALIENEELDPALSLKPDLVDPTLDLGRQTQGPGGNFSADTFVNPNPDQGPKTDGSEDQDPTLGQEAARKKFEDMTDIPDGWENLEWNPMRKLAGALTDDPVTNKETAMAVIQKEVERRKKALGR